MISRRSFLKISGLAAAALSTGYGAGKIMNHSSADSFAINGFIPAENEVVKSLIKSFSAKINSGSTPFILAEGKWKELISGSYNQRTPALSLSKGTVSFRMFKLNGNVDSDILIYDSKNFVYNPDMNFSSEFLNIRSKIRNRKAEYLFSAEYKNESFLSSVLKSNEKVLIVENEYGIAERINLNNSFKNIEINGAQGKTGIRVENGVVHVHTASCKNQICKHSGYISEPGYMIACAPNKVLMRIDKA